MPGYRAIYDEESSRVEAVDKGGIPFRIANLAAIEEVVGVREDIAEGDASGREEDDPGISEDLETRRDELEKETEKDVGGTPLALDADRQKVVEALVAEGEGLGYIDMIDQHEEFLELAQRFLEGESGVSLDDLVEYAEDNDLNGFLKGMGREVAPSAGI